MQLLAIINKAMNMVVHVSLLYVGASLGYTPRSGITGSSETAHRLYEAQKQKGQKVEASVL